LWGIQVLERESVGMIQVLAEVRQLENTIDHQRRLERPLNKRSW